MRLKRASKPVKGLIIESLDKIKSDDGILLWSAKSLLHNSVVDTKEAICIPEACLLPGSVAVINEQAVEVHFSAAQQIISSAVLNGGVGCVDHFINLHLPSDRIVGVASPDVLFEEYFANRSSDMIAMIPVSDCRKSLGMMTAASMRSCRITSKKIADEKITVLATTGLGNLRAAGDPADYPHLYLTPDAVGTINLLVATTACLSPAAQIETLMMITEAKVAALLSLGLKSPVSGNPATGTGTDAIAVSSGKLKASKPVVEFVGKHTRFGETLARLVMLAIYDSAHLHTSSKGC